MNELSHYPLTHGGIRKILHPRLGVEIDNQTCVRYLRFARQVEIDDLELPRSAYGRWTPAVPTHPAHLVLSIPDGERWQVVKEVDLPYDPRIAGEGLRQEMELPEVEAIFAAILKEPPLRIELDGLRTRSAAGGVRPRAPGLAQPRRVQRQPIQRALRHLERAGGFRQGNQPSQT